MQLHDYQQKAGDTAHYPQAGNNFIFPTLGLAGEAGEIANKVKKIERDYGGVITDDVRAMIASELGDLLWYTARLATELGLELEKIAEDNVLKLQDRKERGVLHGSGDVR